MIEKKYPTPHIDASPDDFAGTVLMPGDPLRSRVIAEEFLTDARLINNVRGVQGYTGKYLGVPVTVMAHGMGMPSVGIYSYELFNIFGVDRIIRIGSCGSFGKAKLMDVIMAQGACTNSAYGDQFCLPGAFAPICDFEMLSIAVEEGKKLGASVRVGNILSSDHFYGDDPTAPERWAKMGVLGTEMESAALYMNAARAGKRALAMFTVSDYVIGDKTDSLTAEERQNNLTDMISIALNTALELERRYGRK